MILDNNLTFLTAKDSAVTDSPAVALGQADLDGNNKGLTPYNNLILHVTAGETISSPITVTLETSNKKDSGFATLMTYPAVASAKPGDTLVREKLPWGCLNWLRIKLSTAKKVNAHLVLDVDKKYPMV